MRASLFLSCCVSIAVMACGGKTTVDGESASTDKRTSSAGGPGSTQGTPGSEPSGDPAAPSSDVPRARIIVETNGGEPGSCLPPFAVGAFGDGTWPDRPVDSESIDRGAKIIVGCTVAPSPNGYIVQGSAIAGDGRGIFTLTARPVDATGQASGIGNIRILWGDRDWVLTDSNAWCTLDASVASPLAGIAPGRYWGAFRCTGLETTEHQPCTMSGVIRIENCRTTTE